MSELLSYKHILDDIKKFKRAGTKTGDDFNIYDTPSQKYFKILFYFGSTPELFTTDSGSGLLAPTWEIFNSNYIIDTTNLLDSVTNFIKNTGPEKTKSDYYNYNSAWAYLKLNDENERAEKLEQFVTLLSDINTYSPWYFSTINGVQEALERKSVEDGKLEMIDKKLTITCLPDAFDNRIGTLLELYRDITWSWIHKKEIIPSNLRKFDMAIYIFETPEFNWHNFNNTIGIDNKFNTSYKMIEFHDCEFNYNSIKSAWNELNNQTGINPTYTIEITYSDCYEVSYNDIMMRKIGDVILTDMLNSNKNENDYESYAQSDDKTLKAQIEQKTYPYDKGFIGNIVDQVAGHLKSDIKDLVNKKLMGNIHGLSITQAVNNIEDFMQGNLIKTGMTAAQFIKEQKNKNNVIKEPTGNIYSDSISSNTNNKPTGDLFEEPEKNNKKPSGDLFEEPEKNNNKPSGDLFEEPEKNNKKPTGDLFPNINVIKRKPIGNIFKSSIANNL